MKNLIGEIFIKTANRDVLVDTVRATSEHVEEREDVWVDFASNKNMEPWRRAFSIVQFFLRHSRGRNLKDLIKNQKICDWFHPEGIIELPFTTGVHPVEPFKDDSSYYLLIPSTEITGTSKVSISISILPQIEESTLRSGFATYDIDPQFVVIDVGATETYDDDLLLWMHPLNVD